MLSTGSETITCRWFPHCDRPATEYLTDPVRGELPTCDQCRAIAVFNAVRRTAQDR